LTQIQHRDGRGSLAFSLLDARKFAIKPRASPRGSIAQEQILSAARAHGLENVVGIHRIQRTQRAHRRFGAGGFGDEPRRSERMQHLLRQPGRDAPDRRKISWTVTGGRQRWKRLPDARHISRSAMKFASALVHIFGKFVLQIRPAVLERVGDLRAEQQDRPGKNISPIMNTGTRPRLP